MTTPDYCRQCKSSVASDHWYWQKTKRCKAGGRWRCKQQNRDNARRWRIDSFAQSRLTSYRMFDKKRGFECTLTLSEIELLLRQPCYYCGISDSRGLDRIDNNVGHTDSNVVPCCGTCNIILSDLPFIAKEKLKSGLYEIRQAELLKGWVPPIRRNR